LPTDRGVCYLRAATKASKHRRAVLAQGTEPKIGFIGVGKIGGGLTSAQSFDRGRDP